MIKIYSISNNFVIESVSAGVKSDYEIRRDGEKFSIWRRSGAEFEVLAVPYASFADQAGNSFSSPDALAAYFDRSLRVETFSILSVRRRAARPLSAGRVVKTEFGTLDLVSYASAERISDAFAICGVTRFAAAEGSEVEIVSCGEISDDGWNWQSPGPLFLGADGYLVQRTAAQAVFSVQVAVAIAPDKIIVGLKTPIIFGS